MLNTSGRTAQYLKQIAVANPGHGVGAALLDQLERRYLDEGGIVLMVTASNDGAQRFYEGRGYAQVGEIPGYVNPAHDERLYYKRA